VVIFFLLLQGRENSHHHNFTGVFSSIHLCYLFGSIFMNVVARMGYDFLGGIGSSSDGKKTPWEKTS